MCCFVITEASARSSEAAVMNLVNGRGQMTWPRPFIKVTPIGRLTDMHENWHTHVSPQDTQKSLLDP